MASFAKLGINNIVEKVISIDNKVIKDSNGVEQEQLGVDFINNLYKTNDNWKQTSYNTRGNKHYLSSNFALSNTQEKAFRKNYAGIGYTYDEIRNAFIPLKFYNSWILNEDTCLWEAPIPYPITNTKNEFYGDGSPKNDLYTWNEETLSWDLVTE
jgi:hypothetical protein